MKQTQRGVAPQARAGEWGILRPVPQGTTEGRSRENKGQDRVKARAVSTAPCDLPWPLLPAPLPSYMGRALVVRPGTPLPTQEAFTPSPRGGSNCCVCLPVPSTASALDIPMCFPPTCVAVPAVLTLPLPGLPSIAPAFPGKRSHRRAGPRSFSSCEILSQKVQIYIAFNSV